MNPTPEQPELEQLSAELAGLLERLGLDPAGERPARRDRIDVRFAAVAAAHPGRIAAQDAEDTATYLELELLADDIARRLSGRAGPGEAVAVRARRTCAAAAAVVGVMRSGAAVLPLEPGHNPGLQEFLMRDSGAEMVLSDSGLLRDEIPVAKAGPFVVAVRPEQAVRRQLPERTAFLALPSAGGNPGRALSVEPVTHLDVLSWVDVALPTLEAGPDDVWTSYHSMSLDLGMREMWGPLLSGARAVVVDRDTACDAREFARTLTAHGVTVLTQLPSALARLTTAAAGTRIPSLRHVVLAGEPVPPSCPAAWHTAAIAPQATVWDLTGPPTRV
ncbi:AMP-binding protein [Streptomyces antimicrobicus]|uniref:AMP-binding protein n=1 Tax=Streptomyces antimicrobicus TaxID=2883108 RepID=A0ABS8B1W2_9ACTN|nr:AMP-binding protein [Streptomyces antimicrobicus]MCB5178562.1 AMP-binding protein [Streptomyces antimicrobicus]